jgi:hypothetical protein
VNDSFGSVTLVLAGDGFELAGFDVVVDPEGVTATGRAALCTPPHPASAAVIISAQLIGSVLR